MVEFLIYDLKVAALVAVFYMFYRLLLSRETFHRANRIVLLATAVASFVLPLCVITLHKTVVVSGTAGTISLDGLGAMVMEEPQTPLWQTLLVAVFFIGMAATLGYTLLSVLRVWLLIRGSERHPQADGTVVCVVDADVSPFSWMHYIVLSPSDYNTSPEKGFILAHERGHISQHHSADLLLVDTLTALQWFNPAMWMLRQDLRAIHEYEADAAVLSQGINMRQYQYLLIQKAVSHCGYSVANGISHSTLRNRIDMMLNNKKSRRASLLKLLALAPIVGVALALQAETVNDYVYNEPKTPQKKIVKKGRKDGTIKMGANTIEVKTDTPAVTGSAVVMVTGNAVPVDLPEKQDPKKDPMIIIDGKVATFEQMKTLDSESIEHMEVMKSAHAKEVYSKIYQGDASNGVIVITTKQHAEQRKIKEQEESPEYAGVFDVVEQMPEFPGGMQAMMQFLSENIRYPKTALDAGVEGRVIVRFIVEEDGTISNAKVVKKVSDDLDAEAQRLVENMPKWKPGMQNGKVVRVKYTIPISFRLS